MRPRARDRAGRVQGGTRSDRGVRALGCPIQGGGSSLAATDFEEHFEEAYAGAIAHRRPLSGPALSSAVASACAGRSDAPRPAGTCARRSALDTFERLGAEPWANRARGELNPTGETARKRSRSGPEQ